MSVSDRVLAVARAQLGYVEQGGPHGNDGNVTKFWDWWDAADGERDQGQSWCGCFVSWCFDQAGARLDTVDRHNGPGFVYCPDAEAHYTDAGRVVDRAHATPGCVVFFHFDGEPNEANHTGILESCDTTGVTCIEGNTLAGPGGNQSNGGGVYRRTRPWSCVRTVCHPPQLDAVDLTAPTPPQEDDTMKPVAGTPSWCGRQNDGAFPRFKATPDGGDAVVVSIDNAPFTPAWSAGSHSGYTDFAAYGLWCRRFPGAGEPYAFAEVAGAFFLIADHGTFDIAHEAATTAR